MKSIIYTFFLAFSLVSCGGVEQVKHNGIVEQIRVATTDSETDAESQQLLAAVAEKTAPELTIEERKALQEALTKMGDYCSGKLTSLEKESDTKAKRAFWLSVAGAVSGSVLAPALVAGSAANGVSVAAFSGFSGATNFLSQSLASSGLSGTSAANDRNKIVDSIWENLKVAFDESKKIGTRTNAVDQAKASCEFYKIFSPSIPTAGKS